MVEKRGVHLSGHVVREVLTDLTLKKFEHMAKVLN